MRQTFLSIIIFVSMFSITAYAFDDQQTHRKLTEKAIPNSNVDGYLVNYMGYSSGIRSVFNGYDRTGNKKRYPIEFWLQEGSSDEDALNRCRAASHFHNPLFMDWTLAGMSDSTLTDFICGFDRKLSAVTWATGYSTSASLGTYKEDRSEKYIVEIGGIFFPALLYNVKQDMGWDHGRSYLYEALKATDTAVREEKFVKTFRAVGQVLHLLQDMAVPAHVRNDMDSHLFTALWPSNWMNPFEQYVKSSSTAYAAMNKPPEKPEFVGSVYVTDFWDKDVYSGHETTQPDQNNKNQGLAEYTNANYFSTSTIPFNNPSDDHKFPYPQITATNVICTDKLQNSVKQTKYVSREPCQENGTSVDHFAAVSLLNEEDTDVSALKEVWLDDNVHNSYVQTILPRAVGYSAALLDYFFRGKLTIAPVTPGDITFHSVKVTVSNATPNETAATGDVSLVIRYKALAETGTGLVTTLELPAADYTYKVVSLANVNLSQPQQLTFDFGNASLPMNYSDMTMQLVYKGKLGNEDGAVAVSKPEPVTGIYSNFHLSLPTSPESSGVYAKTTDDAPAATFTELRVNAMSDIPGGLSGGAITLALQYRTATGDQFQSVQVPTEPTTGIAYIYRAPEKNNVTTLPQNTPVELVFDLSQLPVQATDVAINIIYTKADGTQLIGYRDISEPTPVDAFNNTDKVCIHDQWYDAGSSEAVAAVGTDRYGDLNSDIYRHRIDNILYKTGASGTVAYPIELANSTLSLPTSLNPGEWKRLGYILTDYSGFDYGFDEQTIALDASDYWNLSYGNVIAPGGGFINQLGRGFSGMYSIRGKKIWGETGIIYDNEEYPAGSQCDWSTLP